VIVNVDQHRGRQSHRRQYQRHRQRPNPAAINAASNASAVTLRYT
jgi:hypothetical protein